MGIVPRPISSYRVTRREDVRVNIDIQHGIGGTVGLYTQVRKLHEDFMGTVVRVEPLVGFDNEELVYPITSARTTIKIPFSMLPIENILLRISKEGYITHESLFDLNGDMGISVCLDVEYYLKKMEPQPLPVDLAVDKSYILACKIKKIFNLKP